MSNYLLTKTLLLAVLLGTAFASATERPNIILAMADDQGWGDMAYNGHPALRTPAFDEMARTGLRFDRFYAAAPVCSPTRGSVLTGRHPNRFGCFTWGYTLRPEEITIAEILRQAGYTTSHFGKWHLGAVRADSPVSPGQSGFDTWVSGPNFFDFDPWLSDRGKGKQFKGEGSEIVVELALQFIRESAGRKQPFLAVVWFGSPHVPHAGTEADLALYADQPEKQRPFLAEITAMDRAMGNLRRGLRQLGIAENTILWYCSDNGAIPQGSTGGLRGQKGSIYEGGLRVPGLIEWPARIRQPRAISLPCGTVDIFPTLLELAGIANPGARPLDGQSLAPLLDGEIKARSRPLGFWAYPAPGQPARSDDLVREMANEQAEGKTVPASAREPKQTGLLDVKYPEDKFPGHSAWLDGNWKLHRIEPKGGGSPKWELYDLANDKAEARDVTGLEPDRLRRMQGELQTWLASVVRSLNGADY
jgi:arylsulfatase A-like enzyme